MKRKQSNIRSSFWDIAKFGNLVEFKNGLNFRADDKGYPIKVLGVGDFLHRSELRNIDNLSTVNLSRHLSEEYLLKDGDLVFVRSNGSKALVGRCLIVYPGKEKVSFSGFTIRARVKTSNVLPRFLSLFLQTGVLRKALKREGAGTNISNLNQGILSDLNISVPTPETQRKLIQILDTWDLAIEKTERLIAAKERRYKGLLNTLICHDNLKEWKRFELGEITQIKKGQQLNVADMIDDGIYYALNGGIEPSGHTDKWNMLENTITISEGGNSCGFVNFNTRKFWCGGHCYALIDVRKDVETKYLYHFLKAHEQLLMSLRVGSGLPNIQKKDLQKIPVIFPVLTEQKKIAKLFDAAREEINLLKRKTEFLRKQKRGLMQKLLTGEWRVKV